MDVSKLKMKQLAEVEELSGYNMDEWETCPKVKLTMAIAFVLGKMKDPELTWEKVENMSIDEMQNISGDIEAPKANNS